MSEWDDWSEDTPVEVLRRYLATFGEPAPIEAPRQPESPRPRAGHRGEPWDELRGCGHPRRSREFRGWRSAPKEQNELRLERIALGLECLIAVVDYRTGRRRG
jgi:hypothetical protein